MKHKISLTILAAVLLISMLFVSGAVYAQDETLPDPGMTPDSPFYFMDKLGKSIGMAFTFGSEAKAQKALQYAEERLAEMQTMALKNKEKQMEQAAGQYDKYMAMLQERMEETAREGQSDNVSERVALATANHLEVLEKLREQVNERAREAIANAENVSMNGQMNALRVMSENRLEKALEICDNITAQQMEKVRARITAGAAENGISGNLTGLLDYADRIAALQEQMIQRAAQTGANITGLQERLNTSTANRLQTLSEVYEKAPVQARSAIADAIENSVRKYEQAAERLQSGNMTMSSSVNATLEKIQEQLRDRIQSTISNQTQTGTANSGNATQLKVNTQTQEQERQEIHATEVTPATGTGSQTKPPNGDGNQGSTSDTSGNKR